MLRKRLSQRLFFSIFSSRYQIPVALHREDGGERLARARYLSINAGCIDGKSWYRYKNPRKTLLPFKCTLTPSVHTSNHVLLSSTPIEISQTMLPSDSNLTGNVHGGTILKMMEQAGHVVTSRHCIQGTGTSGNPITMALVRLEKMDFHQPMYVGEVAQLKAALTYTSSHSLEVVVDVWAENVLMGQRRHASTATLWYVPVFYKPMSLLKAGDSQLRALVAPVPQLLGLSEAEKEAGKRRYETQKASRVARSRGKQGGTNKVPAHEYLFPEGTGEGMVLSSQSTLANIVLPSDCTWSGHIMAGTLMKMMDTTAGVVAYKHFYGDARIVSTHIDVINFHQPVTCWEMVYVTAKLIFTSSKSMEIEVSTEGDGPNHVGRHITNTAYFTFMSLGKDGRAVYVPPLQCRGEEEKARFEEGRLRYMARKKERMEATKKAPNQ